MQRKQREFAHGPASEKGFAGRAESETKANLSNAWH